MNGVMQINLQLIHPNAIYL